MRAQITDLRPNSVEQRLGPDLAVLRRQRERGEIPGAARFRFPLQQLEPIFHGASHLLGLVGLLPWLCDRALSLEFRDRVLTVGARAESLCNLSVLHLSDLHIDAWPGQGERLASVLRPWAGSYDLVAMTGDFRFDVKGSIDAAVENLAIVVAALQPKIGCYAVLGNHDPLDIVLPLEELGVRVLLNEGELITHDSGQFWLAGVDDPHWFGTDDLETALAAAPVEIPRILLAHSPELAFEAAAQGVDLYLCGHTHGGQVCLPGGFPLLKNCRSPRAQIRDHWQLDGMVGYTSRGTGFSGLPLRSFCRGEVSRHRIVTG